MTNMMAPVLGVAVASSKVVGCVVVLALLVLAPSASAQRGYLLLYPSDARCRGNGLRVYPPSCYQINPQNGYKFVSAGNSMAVFYKKPGCNERDKFSQTSIDAGCFPPGILSVRVMQRNMAEATDVPVNDE